MDSATYWCKALRFICGYPCEIRVAARGATMIVNGAHFLDAISGGVLERPLSVENVFT